MMELLNIYLWTILAGSIFAGSLALLGCQLAARDRAMQTLCLSQGALFGVLIALGLDGSLTHDDPEGHLIPFASATLAAVITFFITEGLSRRRSVSKNTLFASVFSLLLASGYMVSAIFPALESHMSQIYFGDLATLTEFDAKVTLVLGSLSAVALLALRYQMTAQSFEFAVFGTQFSRGGNRMRLIVFNLVALALLCFSVQFLGFLFTIAMLFLPTTVLNFSRLKGLNSHLLLAFVVAVASTAVGFIFSLGFTRLPTVPTVSLTLLAVAAGVSLITRAFLRFGVRAG